jgi:hypothetical protein
MWKLTLNFFCENIQNKEFYKSKKLMSKPGQKSDPNKKNLKKTKKNLKEKKKVKSETKGSF